MSTERCPTAADRFLKAKRGLFDRLYGTMNEKQREAVFKIDGPLLILAGAGTGKTTVLVNRIAFIVKFGNAYADESIPAELSERDIKALEEAVDLEPEQMEQALLPYACSPCPPWAVLSITFTNKAAKEMKERLERILGEAAKKFGPEPSIRSASVFCADTAIGWVMRLALPFMTRTTPSASLQNVCVSSTLTKSRCPYGPRLRTSAAQKTGC